MSEPSKYAVGQTVEHKESKRRAQIVTLDKGTMMFRPLFEASEFGPAHFAEPNGLESIAQWDIVEAKAVSGKDLQTFEGVQVQTEHGPKEVTVAKPTPKVPKR